MISPHSLRHKNDQLPNSNLGERYVKSTSRPKLHTNNFIRTNSQPHANQNDPQLSRMKIIHIKESNYDTHIDRI